MLITIERIQWRLSIDIIVDRRRSTKGASKQRRDLINVEILQIRDLLPLPESARQRLSQLQIMSLACCYIRKSSCFSKREFAYPLLLQLVRVTAAAAAAR